MKSGMSKYVGRASGIGSQQTRPHSHRQDNEESASGLVLARLDG